MFILLMISCGCHSDYYHQDDSKRYEKWLRNEQTSTYAKSKPKNIRDWKHQDWNPNCTQQELGVRILKEEIQEIFRLDGYPGLGLFISSNENPEKYVLYNLNPTNIHRLEQKSGGMILYDRGDIIFDLDSIRSHGYRGNCTLMYGDNLEACISSQYELEIIL
jgi:hypothetical protein